MLFRRHRSLFRRRGLGLLGRYLVEVFLLHAVVVVGFLLVLNSLVIDSLEDAATQEVNERLDRIAAEVDATLSELRFVASMTASLSDLRTVILVDESVAYEQYRGFKTVFSLITSFDTLVPYSDIFLFSMERSRVYSTYSTLLGPSLELSGFPQTEWYARLPETVLSGMTTITNFGNTLVEGFPRIAVIAPLRYRADRVDGVVAVSLGSGFLADVVHTIAPSRSGRVSLLTDDGVIVATTGPPPAADTRSVVFERALEARRFLVRLELSPAVLRESATVSRPVLLGLSAGMLVIVLAINAGLFGSIVRELRKLTDFTELALTTKQISFADLTRRDDEVGELSTLVASIVDRNIRNELLMKDARIELLQSQINPHFLYNTLESVCSIALTKNQPAIADIVARLGRYLRYSSANDSQASNLTSLSHELESLDDYVSLFRLRDSQKLTYDVTVAGDVLPLQLPRLTLQPLVENAIIHGSDNLRRAIAIRVSVARHDDTLRISVSDDGVGMSANARVTLQERLDSLGQSEARSGHIGLANVQERIRLTFGMEWGVHVDLSRSRGFGVTLELPAVEPLAGSER